MEDARTRYVDYADDERDRVCVCVSKNPSNNNNNTTTPQRATLIPYSFFMPYIKRSIAIVPDDQSIEV